MFSRQRDARPTRGTILYRLTLPSLAAVFLLWVGYTLFWAGQYESRARAEFEENGQRAAQLFAGAVAGALWEFDQASAHRTLSGLSAWPSFAAVSVTDSGGQFALFEAADRRLPQRLPDLDGMADVPHRENGFAFFGSPIVHPSHGEIGQLVVGFDQHPLQSMIWSARQLAIASAALGFVLLGTLLFYLARTVTMPLVRITEAVEQVAAGDLDWGVPDVKGNDEVGRLARALEVFRQDAARLIEAKADVEANRRIADLALIDDLTGLANRRAVKETFARLDEDLGVHPTLAASVLQIDLDRFKQINDTLGHKAGDHVICAVADRLSDLGETCSLVARLGGDEFVILVRHTAGADIPQQLAERSIRQIARPIPYGDQLLRVGASVGIATHRSGAETMADTLLNADIALYRAKDEGKARFVTFDDRHRQEIVDRKRISDEILESIEAHRFVPFFQTIHDAQTNEVVAVELLTRWTHPSRGILPPAEFLGIADDLDLTRLIDRQVFGHAIDTFDTWRAEGLSLPRLCVNVSVTRILEPDFIAMLSDARQAGIDVDVELLESIYLDQPDAQLMWQLDRIRDLGVGLNIDDFGTGHASVAGLMQIEPDKVKIDRQFVIPMLESDRSHALVKALIGMCALLDIKTVAEGVETPDHATLLQELGCDYLQGYAFSHPVSAPELRAVLTGARPRRAV